MAKGGEQMDAMQARLGRSNHVLLTQVDHHLIIGHPLDARRGGAHRRKALHKAASRVDARVVPKALQDRGVRFLYVK